MPSDGTSIAHLAADAAACRDQRCVHHLIVAGPHGKDFLRDLCAFGWTDDGQAGARIFSSTVSCSDDGETLTPDLGLRWTMPRKHLT